MSTPSFQHICGIMAAVRCLNSGQSFARIAKSAKVSVGTVRKWVKEGGFRKVGNQWVHCSM